MSRLSEPVIRRNEEYVLEFDYPKWADGNKLHTIKYEYGRLNGKATVRITEGGKTVRSYNSVGTAVYEDEGTFGSAGLFNPGMAILLKGFVAAAEHHHYYEKWSPEGVKKSRDHMDDLANKFGAIVLGVRPDETVPVVGHFSLRSC